MQLAAQYDFDLIQENGKTASTSRWSVDGEMNVEQLERVCKLIKSLQWTDKVRKEQVQNVVLITSAKVFFQGTKLIIVSVANILKMMG